VPLLLDLRVRLEVGEGSIVLFDEGDFKIEHERLDACLSS
jgi:hypothetical protein